MVQGRKHLANTVPTDDEDEPPFDLPAAPEAIAAASPDDTDAPPFDLPAAP
jgi:hypothetical protein